MNNPKVYVGTYGKYNRGSIAGGWVSLRECKDYRAFLAKCRALHRGERDPEYMIQDSEDFPDGLDCMEWLSEQDFNDVMTAIREQDAEEQATPAPSLAEQLRAVLLQQISPTPDPSPKERGVPADYKVWLEEYIAKDKADDADYYRKHYVGALKHGDRYWLIEKSSIENRFCFHDEGSNYEFYCHLMEDKETRLAAYFKQKNLAKFDDLIDHIEKGDKYNGDKRVWWYDCYNGNSSRICVNTNDRCFNSIEAEKLTLCTDEERAQILAAAKYGRALMEKRLDAYLKRYGVSKLHTWTYWADA